MSVDEESDEETGAEDGEEGVPHGRAPVQHVIGRVGGLGHVLLQRLVRVGDMSNSIRGSDIIGALFGGSDDIFRYGRDESSTVLIQCVPPCD